MIPAMIIAPLAQMIILVFAANLTMKDINFSILDDDRTSASINLGSRFSSSPFFTQSESVKSLNEADKLLRGDKVKLVIHIPVDFEKDIYHHNPPQIQFLVNGINSAAAVLIAAYAQNILMDYNRDLIPVFSESSELQGSGPIVVSFSHWYNPNLDFKIFMVPGILVILVTLVGWLLLSLNVVSEKELGTIEQINVTPVKKYQFLIGKLIPFWLLAIVELGIGLTLGRLLFHVPILGSIWLLVAFTAIYLITILGFGLLVAAISDNQQQVMFLNFFFVLTFILMSGIFTPVESMPEWAHMINYINPLSYFMRVIRMILLKGSGFGDVWKEFLSMGIFGIAMISLAVRSYRKRV
jgi:ABC-2 type transport system permease protein